MRLTVLGSAGSFPGPDSAASGYLVQADDADGRTWTVLLDLGNGALSPLQRYGDATALDAIGVSHLHSDHVADLVVLNVLTQFVALPASPWWSVVTIVLGIFVLWALVVHGDEAQRASSASLP